VKGGKWGFINEEGKIVIDPIFDEADSFKGNLSHVRIVSGTITKSGDYIIGEGYIDTTGKFVSFKDFSDKKFFGQN
ncbi:MAG TPA: WG repeat-containing protein, partial [Nitrosopumilaceae archaeon]|nr:WG repeat-containing protein [Nitrosopumilaceae archaeon]